jgi:peptidoglycan-N-acetylglucosamine deacetylase
LAELKEMIFMKWLFSLIYRRMFSERKVSKIALSSSLGVLIGIIPFMGSIPLDGIRVLIALLISFVFKLNIAFILVGMLLTMITPIASSLSTFIFQLVSRYDIAIFKGTLDLASAAMAGIIIALVMYPAFYVIYRTFLTRSNTTADSNGSPIFQDTSGKRMRVLKTTRNIIIVLGVIALTVLGSSFAYSSDLPDMGFSSIKNLDKISASSINTFTSTVSKISSFKNQQLPDYSGADKKVLAYYVSWDDESFQSLKINHTLIDIVSPDWYTINNKLELGTNIQPEVDQYIKENVMEEIPVLSNNINENWDSTTVHNLVTSTDRKNIIATIVQSLKTNSFAGINLDIENIDETDKISYTSFVKDLYAELNKNNLKLIIDLPAADATLDYKTLSKNCDYVVLLMYDENSDDGTPGPVASLKWSEGVLNSAGIPAEKLLGGVGSYGYDWTIGSSQPAVTVGFVDLMDIAVAGNAKIVWDDKSQNPYMTYKKDNIDHLVWFLDGTTFFNQVKAAFDKGAYGIALWRLGGEDPSVWKVIKDVKNKQSSENNSAELTKGSTSTSAAKQVLAFYVSYDDNSMKSLKENSDLINIIVPDWYKINSKLELETSIQPEVDKFIKANNMEEIPLINNYINDKWDPEIVHNLVTTENRKAVISAIVESLKANSYAGINLDIENINETDKKAYTGFVQDLYVEMHKNNLKLIIDLPSDDETLDYKTLSQSCDYVALMVYDESSDDGTPGPVASLSWSKKVLNSADIPADKLLGGIGSYGYDWSIGSKDIAKTVGFEEVMQYASVEGVKVNWDKDSQNPYLTYKKDNIDHEVWFLDGATFYNQVKATYDIGAAGIAIWSLGDEDPTIWKLLKDSKNADESLKDLKNIDPLTELQYSGAGEIYYVDSDSQSGQRDVSLDADGYISDAGYTSIPTGPSIKLFGKQEGKVISLTFDDGPDPTYTPKILDILKKYNIKATFFVVGQNAQANPDIIQRMYNEGHEIGNHSYTHPNIGKTSAIQTTFELNSTQRIIEAITGHSTVLFRPPYDAAAELSGITDYTPTIRAQQLGYVTIGESIDPLDWQAPTTEELYTRVMTDLNDGNTILFHDAGGNRDSTVAALPIIIESLIKQGYTFDVTSQMMGKNRDEIMPAIVTADNRYALFNNVTIVTFNNLKGIITVLFYLALAFGTVRLLSFIILSKLQKRKAIKSYENAVYEEGVSVVIAAYNEEAVICKTVDSVLNSSFEDLEVVVVDDGSKDRTLEVLKDKYSNDRRVKIYTKENGGKTSALNMGFSMATNDVIVAIDADTIIDREAISYMARHFNNPKVGAVSGNIKVGNINNMLTKCQYMEYVTGFNLEKRAFSMLNCIAVVPGAIGAWRKSAVAKCGYYSSQTLAEDTDMTIELVRQGYIVELEARAKAYTEAPETVRNLVKQRNRWAYGILQCLWKHRDALFRPEYKFLGLVAMPTMWIFQYVFLIISPFADLYFINGILTKPSQKIFLIYIFFLTFDLIAVTYAFTLEKEYKVNILWIIVQRTIYRLIMVYVAVKSIISALGGRVVGWNKLKRTGSVVSEKI